MVHFENKSARMNIEGAVDSMDGLWYSAALGVDCNNSIQVRNSIRVVSSLTENRNRNLDPGILIHPKTSLSLLASTTLETSLISQDVLSIAGGCPSRLKPFLTGFGLGLLDLDGVLS